MAFKRKMRTVTEDIVLDKPMKVDRENGIIFHVKICGRNSKHGYEYSQRALEEAAQQYSSVKVNVDHPPRDNPTKKRTFGEWFGKLKEVKVEDDGVYGDMHYLKSHAQANIVAEAAERMPDFGLSHVADVFEKNVGGKRVVESVGKVRSVDIVCNPATNQTLFESEDSVPKLTVKQVLSRKVNKKFKPLLTILEESEYTDATVEAPTDEAGAEAEMKPGSEEEMKAAFSSMIQAAFEDSSLDMKATIRKVREIIKAYYKLSEEPEPEEETDEGPEEEEESKTETDDEDKPAEAAEEEDAECKCKRLEAEIVARDLLEEHDIPASPSRVKALVAMEDEDERLELIGSFPKRGTTSRPGVDKDGLPTKKPRSSTRMEDTSGTIAFPEGGKFAAAIKERVRFSKTAK